MGWTWVALICNLSCLGGGDRGLTFEASMGNKVNETLSLKLSGWDVSQL
jgi:hypothetical protein